MNERLERALLIAGFVLTTLALGFLLYWLFFRTPPEEEVVEGEVPGVTGQLPGAKTGAPTGAPTLEPGALPSAPTIPGVGAPTAAAPSRTVVLKDTVTQAISLSPSGGLRSYDPNDGKFYKIANDGSRVAMSDQVFYNVEKVNWGKASDKAIMEYPDGSNILYDFQTQKQVTLPKHWEDFNFAPQDERIVAKSVGTSEENRFLVTSNPDGTNAKLIEELGRNQDKVHTTWSPNNQVIAYSFTGQPLGFDRQEVLLVGQNHENFKGLVVEGRGLQPKWSPTGNNLVYSVYSAAEGFRPTLWFSGASGDSINANRRNLNLQTWAEKCAFQSESIVICAVPNQLGEGAGLQPGLFVNNPDSLYRIDLESGQSVNLGAPEGNRSINQLVISPDGQYVYFNDNLSGQVIRYEL